MNLKVSGLGFSIAIYGIKTLQNQNRIFIYKNVILALGGRSSPINPHINLQNNPSSYLSKITAYDIFLVFGHWIPSYYVQGNLWTKLAPACPFPGVYILHWGQLDKMQQLLSIIFEDFKILPIRIETALRCFIYCAHDLGCIFFK